MKIIKYFMVLLVILISIAGCDNSKKQMIEIGHIGPLTGDDAIYGIWEKEGMDLALKQINESENGHLRIKIIEEDDQSKPSRAVSSLQKLIEINKINMIIGPTLSSSVLACAPIANDKQVVLITPSAQSPKLKLAGDYVFQLFISSTVEGKYLANLADSFDVSRISVICHSSDYGIGLREVLTQQLQKTNKELVSIETYPLGTKDFRPFITRIKSKRPDALYILAFPLDIAQILIQIKENNLNLIKFAPDAFEANEIYNIAKNAVDSVIYVYPILPEKNKYLVEVQDAFFNNYKKEMNVYNAVAYDALNLYYNAVKNIIAENKKITGKNVKDYFSMIKNYNGTSGIISFDKNGDVIERPMEVRLVRGNQIKRLY